MNVLVVSEAGTWFDDHLTASLRQAGHQVSVFHYGNFVGEYYPRARWSERERKNRDLLRQATRFKSDCGLDLIFCYVYDDFLLPEVAAALTGLGAPMLNYNVDMTNQWYRQIRTARYFTGMLCAQRVHMKDLGRYGAPVHYFPMAAQAPEPGNGDDVRVPALVTFIGTPTAYRIAVLGELLSAGIPIAIYGRFWKEGQIARPERNLQKALDTSAPMARAAARGRHFRSGCGARMAACVR